MATPGANAWSVPLEINNLEAQIAQIGAGAVQSVSVGNANLTLSGTAQNPILSGTLTALTSNVATSNFALSGNTAGNPSFVLTGTEEFKVITSDLTPHILVSGGVSGGVQLGLPSGYGGYKVTAPTVTPSTDSTTQVATTAFVQSVVSAIPAPTTPALSAVLTAGNTATNSISLNNTGIGTNVISLLPNAGVADPQITLTDGTTTNTINKNGYTTRNSVQNSAHFLNFSDASTTGVGAIQKTAGIGCNPSTNTVSATTFSGALSGNATSATNLAGGLGGSIPYQSAVNTTVLLANGTSGQVLTSQGTTLAPTWTTISTGGNSSNSASKVLFEDFTNTNITSATFYGQLSLSFNASCSGVITSTGNRVGVINMTSPTFVGTGFGAIWRSVNTGSLTPISGEGQQPSSISTSSTGLGMTFIFQSSNATYTNSVILFGLARFDTFAVYGDGSNFTFPNMTISYDTRNIAVSGTGKWIARLGSAFAVFPSVPSGTLNNKYLVGRIVPNASATGVDYYLYNQTDGVDYGSVSLLYSADTTGTTATTIYMSIGGGIKAFGATTPTIFCDFVGYECFNQRIYP